MAGVAAWGTLGWEAEGEAAESARGARRTPQAFFRGTRLAVAKNRLFKPQEVSFKELTDAGAPTPPVGKYPD